MKSSMKFASYIIFTYNITDNDKIDESKKKDDKTIVKMTNDHQTIVERIGNSEIQNNSQNHEIIQLTELLPVEQSRIKDNPGDKDYETTDGLRALRSFDSVEIENFETPGELECFDKTVMPFEAVADTEIVANGARKRKNDGRTSNGKLGRRKKRKRMNDEFSNSSTMENRENVDDDDHDDTNDFSCVRDSMEDEVYDYRQQQPDTNDVERSNSDEIWSMNLEILSAGVYRDMANNFSGKSVNDAVERSSKSVSSKLRKKPMEKRSQTKTKTNDDDAKKKNKKRPPREKSKVKRKADIQKTNNTTNDSSSTIRTEPDDDLRVKVDGIIQANFYLERENNNSIHANDKKIDDTNESSSISEVNDNTTKSKTTVKDYSKSVDSHEPTKKYNCVMCDSRFKGSGGLRNHYKVMHAAGPLYKCDECGKEFPLKERLKLHVRTHTGFKPYKCSDCPKSFARGGQLAQHRGTHTKVKPYCCNLCKGTFTCAANLALHIKRHNGQKDHKCEICGRGFVRKDALKKHLECLHRDVKSFLCVICNKTFKGHLPQHMRTHAQDRPHGCATCGQRFAQKSQLTVHQRTHSGQRPFRCLVCWQAFAHSTALKLHTRRHTGERPFKCVECNAGFTQLPHWKKHMKCIHGRTEPYSCKNCRSFFRIKNDLESHEKDCRVNENSEDLDKLDEDSGEGLNVGNKTTYDHSKFRSMSVERMRLLLAVLLKRISKPQRLDELGFGKRLIDEVLQDSLVSAGKDPTRIGEMTVLESLRKNLETFLEWTVPKEHWESFRKMKKTPEDILETLTAT